MPAWHDADGSVLARQATSGRGRVIRLERELTPAALPLLLEPDFPRQLLDLLQGPPPAPTRVFAETHAPLPGGPGVPETPRPLDRTMSWLVLALLALERLWATRRRTEAGA